MLSILAALSLLASLGPTHLPATSTGVIVGTVTDDEGELVVGATLVVLGLEGVGAMTDIDGQYRLEVEPGTHTLKVSSVGYQPQTFEVEVADGAQMTLDPVLSCGLCC